MSETLTKREQFALACLNDNMPLPSIYQELEHLGIIEDKSLGYDRAYWDKVSEMHRYTSDLRLRMRARWAIKQADILIEELSK